MNSQTGYIGFAKQANKGTFVAPTIFTKYANDNIGVDSDPIIPSPEIGGGRDITDVYPGPLKISGGLEFDVRTNFAGFALFAVLGQETVSGVDSDVYLHTITPANTIPWISVQKKVSDTYAIFNYTDMKVDSLNLSAEAGAQLVGKMELKGIKEAETTTASTTDYETGEVLMWHSAEIQLEGTTICPASVAIEFKNNLKDDDFRICPTYGRGLGDLPEKRRELNVSLTIRPEDDSLYRKAVYGDATATEPTKQVYSGSFRARFESVNYITGTHKYYIDIYIPKAFMKPFKIEPKGDDNLEHGLDLIPAKDGNNDIVTVMVQNSVDAY